MKNIKTGACEMFKQIIATCLVILCCLLYSVKANAGSSMKAGQNQALTEAQYLAGDWVRPDGGYRLVLGDIKPDGRLNAAYYNPGKINVHEAHWTAEDNGLHLFVELRDENYPGSKYALIYIKGKDVLIGTYFQAVQRETYEIYFVRMGEASKGPK